MLYANPQARRSETVWTYETVYTVDPMILAGREFAAVLETECLMLSCCPSRRRLSKPSSSSSVTERPWGVMCTEFSVSSRQQSDSSRSIPANLMNRDTVHHPVCSYRVTGGVMIDRTFSKTLSHHFRHLVLLRNSKLSLRQAVQFVLFPVQFAHKQPKHDPSDGCKDADGPIVPHEQRIGGQRC